jgi:hypothetical protein
MSGYNSPALLARGETDGSSIPYGLQAQICEHTWSETSQGETVMSALKVKMPIPPRAQESAAKWLPLRTVVRIPAGRLTRTLPTPARRERAIREAAYFRWAYRGCAPGGAVGDWLAAEVEVDEQLKLRDTLIRSAAYARWRTSGCTHGHDVEDWLAAEAEVDSTLAGRGILCDL